MPRQVGAVRAGKKTRSSQLPRDDLARAPIPDHLFDGAERDGPEPDTIPDPPVLAEGEPLPAHTPYAFREAHLTRAGRVALAYTIGYFALLILLGLATKFTGGRLNEVTDDLLIRFLSGVQLVVMVFFFSSAIRRVLTILLKAVTGK